jgi:hypothetical protein
MAAQPRPREIWVRLPADAWVAQKEGRPRATGYAEFLPGRRFVVEFVLEEYETRGFAQVLTAVEQELRADPEPWLLWHDVREVDPSEYYVKGQRVLPAR